MTEQTDAAEVLADFAEWHTGPPNDIYVLQGHQLRAALAAREAAAEVRGAQAVLAAVEAVADGWAVIPDYTASDYDRGRVDQRHMATAELLEAIVAARAAAAAAGGGAWDSPDPDDPPATKDDDPMWGRDR